MRKKILALVLALSLVFSVNAVNLSANALTTEPSITVESVQTVKSENVAVKVLVNNNPGIWGMDLRISYDKTAMTLVSVENGDFFQDSEWTEGNLNGEVYILSYEAAEFNNITTENATLATLNFKVGDNTAIGDYAVTASYNAGDIIDIDFAEIDFHITNGNIKVGCKHTGGTATCKDKAVCSICGEEYGEKNTSNHVGTTKTVGVKAATCTANGYTGDKVCSTCGAVVEKGKIINKLAHKYTNSCDTTCNVCGAKRTVSHTYKTTTTKATLTKNGSIIKKCSVCGIENSTTIDCPKTFKLSATSYTYNGKVITPAVTVKDSKGKALKNGTDYTLSYASGRKNVGKYSVKITFKGNYSGTKTLYFTINPVKTTVSKLTAGTKSIKVAITKKSTGVTGYQIQYSTSKTFKSAKTTTVKSYKTTSVNLTKLSAKKTYYVRVRTYKTVGKTNYYSGWSTYKYIKTK